MIFKVNNNDLADGLLALVKKDVKFKYSPNAGLYDTPLDMIIGPQVQHDSCVGSFYNPPTWLEVSFGRRFIIPSYYSMQGRINSKINGHYLRTWELEGKTKSGKWIKLHNQTNNPFSYGSIKTFAIGSNVPIKSLRINMTGSDSYDKWWICMGHFDVYGHMISASEYIRTCRQNAYCHSSIHIFVLTLPFIL